MKGTIFLLLFILIVQSIVFKDNNGGLNATFYAIPLANNGNWNSNNPNRKVISFDMTLSREMPANNEIVYRDVLTSYLRFTVINANGTLNTGGVVQVSYNGTTYYAFPYSTDGYTHQVQITDISSLAYLKNAYPAPKITILADFTLLSSTTPVIVNGFPAPSLFLVNRPINDLEDPSWRHYVTIPASGNLIYDMNVSYVQFGVCDASTTAIWWYFHYQPHHTTIFSAHFNALIELMGNQKICVIAHDLFASGRTTFLSGQVQSISVTRDKIVPNAVAMNQLFYHSIIEPIYQLGTSTLNLFGTEMGSRYSHKFANDNPGLVVNHLQNTPWMHPCSNGMNGHCTVSRDPSVGIYSTTTGLTFACDPTKPANLPRIMQDVFNDPICGTGLVTCNAQCSNTSVLAFWSDTQSPNVFTNDFFTLLELDNLAGPDQAFQIRCNFFFGPSFVPTGIATGESISGGLAMRTIPQAAIDQENAPVTFPGMPSNAAAVGGACFAASPSSTTGSPMPQPSLSQYVGSIPFPSYLTFSPIYIPGVGLFPFAPVFLEDPTSRTMFTQDFSNLMSGTSGSNIKGDVVIVGGDFWYGAVGGDSGLFAAPPSSFTTPGIVDYWVNTLGAKFWPIGVARHAGLVDQPFEAARAVLHYSV